MKEVIPKLDTSYHSFSSIDDVRSPRTPTYVPSSPSFFTGSAFDPCRLYFSTFTAGPEKPRPPPKTPLPWLWQCHVCNTRYPLGATRRCLYDGHYYCSGEANQRNLKKKNKKGLSCSSEFDYIAWREMGEWKSSVLRHNSKTTPTMAPIGCEKCEFPNQCRQLSNSATKALAGYFSTNSGFQFPSPAISPSDTMFDRLSPSSPGSSISTTPKIEYLSPATRISDMLDEARSRFYTKEDITFDTILARAASTTDTSKCTESKTTGTMNPDQKPTKMRLYTPLIPPGLEGLIGSGAKGFGIKSALSPVAEDVFMGDSGTSAHSMSSLTPLDLYKRKHLEQKFGKR